MFKTKCKRQLGAMAITMTLFFVMMIGFAAVAVDVGHLYFVRNELQNAADAAALAGANCLNKTPTGSGQDCTSTLSPSTTPQWTTAANKAFSTITLNKADGVTLGAGVVQSSAVTTGYKNVFDPIGSTTALLPTTLSPATCAATGPCYKPAVQVTLSKVAGQNGGPVSTLVTGMFGGSAANVTATAVAVISSPSQVGAGSMIPLVINECMYDKYWDSTTNSPKSATTATLDVLDNQGNVIATVPQTIGQPWELLIGEAYHYDACTAGQWTSFDLDVNSQSAFGDLIVSGNPAPLAIGDDTWIQPGTKTASYNDLDAQYPTPLSPPSANTSESLDVALIVVDEATDLSIKGEAEIVAFAGFHIHDVQGGSNKYVQGHFVQGVVTDGSSGVGPDYGATTPARLAQ